MHFGNKYTFEKKYVYMLFLLSPLRNEHHLRKSLTMMAIIIGLGLAKIIISLFKTLIYSSFFKSIIYICHFIHKLPIICLLLTLFTKST